MMQHLPILPILLPMIGAIITMLPWLVNKIQLTRWVSILTLLCNIAIITLLAWQPDTIIYQVGNWDAPFGISLVADNLASYMLLVTGLLAIPAMLYSFSGIDRQGSFFHPLFLFQIMGINGAFLTGDLFNLFVFFEVLLIASYALLIHAGGKAKTQAAIHYVVLNLVGSSCFLIGLGLIYASSGTLNMADLAIKVSVIKGDQAILLQAGALMLFLVFALKAAALPLHFWLPNTYAAASAPVAALFAIMTKVGLYAIWRVFVGIFGDQAGELANFIAPWVWPVAVLTMLVAIIGTLAAYSLRRLAGQLIIGSVAALLFAIALNNPQATAAGLYYLAHSTFAGAALFLIADMVSQQRGKADDRFVPSRPVHNARILGGVFFVVAIALIGMPPLAGFIGKFAIMQAATTTSQMLWLYPLMLIASLATLIAFSRAGSVIFWKHSNAKADEDAQVAWPQLTAVALLITLNLFMVIWAGTIFEPLSQMANQMHQVGMGG
ncbi:monovalent cation/H+ antiporter subunit D [Salinibius halmophilus]|uniref:monovalent cation/H+ antiporter subunit D n=1 Tax=Salinibius halmophilus TaxID=1853216 RepID=UPI000E66F00F|nr:monovalent cation/H+ antiporter subunit D [Salinibius halmophilus]